MSCDAYHITIPHPDGEGVVSAMIKALKSANLRPEDVQYISAHGTGTPANDKAETISIKKVFGEKPEHLAISSIKSMIGHTMGAASVIEAIACALAVQNDIIPPTINYVTPDPECDLDYVPNIARKIKITVCASNSLGFGGHNATLVVKRLD